MNSKRIMVALALALVVSGFCTWLASRRLNTPSTAQTVTVRKYVAPSHALQSGEVLKADDVELVTWSGAEQLEGAFAQRNDLVGREVLFPLSKGEPILDRDLSTPGSGTGLAGKIPEGMRAVALRSDEVVGVAGFLVPGSHLDVLVTYRSDRSPEPVTATVLQNAVVIAAGQQVEPDPGGKPTAATVVTLLLSPQEAERAVLASNQGAVHFILRNGADTSRTQDAPIQLSQLAGEPAPALAPIREAVRIPTMMAAAPRHHEIETILGDPPAEAQPAMPVGGIK